MTSAHLGRDTGRAVAYDNFMRRISIVALLTDPGPLLTNGLWGRVFQRNFGKVTRLARAAASDHTVMHDLKLHSKMHPIRPPAKISTEDHS